jgi:hypothetical protein
VARSGGEKRQADDEDNAGSKNEKAMKAAG